MNRSISHQDMYDCGEFLALADKYAREYEFNRKSLKDHILESADWTFEEWLFFIYVAGF